MTNQSPAFDFFAEVHPEWVTFLETAGLRARALEVLAAVAGDPPSPAAISPPPRLVFEFLRYGGPGDVSVVVVGQDPYPSGADGLCFSVGGGTGTGSEGGGGGGGSEGGGGGKTAPPKVKGSLRTILANLEANGLLRPRYARQDDATSRRLACGDLRSWALQGVLLMNAALTTAPGGRGSHAKRWAAFARDFVRALAARAGGAGRGLVFMLWGNDARRLAPAVNPKDSSPHTVLEWGHPSPLSNNQQPPARRFERAPHFAAANRALRAAGRAPVCWDPLEHVHVFTDGGCVKNGTAAAVAAFAAVVLSGPLAGVRVSGVVPAREFRLVDGARPERGFAVAEPLSAPSSSPAPTNNRAEYLAGCWALLLLVRAATRGRVELVSDSNLFIQTLEAWLPARRRKGTEKELKNFDLILIAERLLARLRGLSTGVRLTHVNSHQKAPPRAQAREHFLWYGNDAADRLASATISACRGDVKLRQTYTAVINCPEYQRWALETRWL